MPTRMSTYAALLTTLVGSTAHAAWPCAPSHIDVTLERISHGVASNNATFGDHFDDVSRDDRKETYVSIVHEPADPQNVRHVVILAAGQQGPDFADIFGNGFQNATTGQQASYKSSFSGASETREVLKCGIYGRLKKASDDGVLPYNLSTDTLVILIFDAAFYALDSTSTTQTKVDAWMSFVGSKVDPGVVEDVWMVGASRGGALTYQMAKAFRANSAWDGVPVWWGGHDAVMNADQGEGGTTTTLIQNPIAPATSSNSCPTITPNLSASDYVANEADPASVFGSDTQDLRLFQIVGGGPVGGRHAFTTTPGTRLGARYLKQTWVDHDHCEIGRKVGGIYAPDTVEAQLDFLLQLHAEDADDTWKVSTNGTADFTAWDSGRGSIPATELLFADVDGDGDTDVLQPTGASIRRASAGSSQFAAWSTWETGSSASFDRQDYAVGDFDGDGIDDVFVATGSQWKIRRGGFSGSMAGFTTERNSTLHTEDLVFGDFDGDGDTDVMWPSGSGGFQLFTSDFSKFFALSGTSQVLRNDVWSSPPQGYMAGDFDGDGRDDLVWITDNAPSENVRVFYTLPSSGGLTTTLQVAPLLGLYEAKVSDHGLGNRVAVGDFDGDGASELLISDGSVLHTADTGGGRNVMGNLHPLNDGPSAWQEKVGLYGIGDFDGDGDDDLLLSQ